MSEKPQPRPIGSMFGSIDVSANPNSAGNTRVSSEELLISLLRQMVTTQDRQTKLMEEMVNQLSAAQRQRQAELGAWKDQNPALAEKCKQAAETLGKVQTQFLESVTDEVIDSDEALLDSDYMLNEFVDRFGPRMVHLNGILQVLAQLSTNATNAATTT